MYFPRKSCRSWKGAGNTFASKCTLFGMFMELRLDVMFDDTLVGHVQWRNMSTLVIVVLDSRMNKLTLRVESNNISRRVEFHNDSARHEDMRIMFLIPAWRSTWFCYEQPYFWGTDLIGTDTSHAQRRTRYLIIVCKLAQKKCLIWCYFKGVARIHGVAKFDIAFHLTIVQSALKGHTM